MICFHHNDADGRCCAALVFNYHVHIGLADRIKFVELDYKDRVPVEIILPDEKVFIVDFSFPVLVMEQVLAVTPNIVWIDHHATAAQYHYGVDMKGIRNFADKAEAACELTWRYLYEGRWPPKSLVLIGDYDKWAMKWEEKSKCFHEGLKLDPEFTKPTSPAWTELLYSRDSGALADAIIEEGKTAIRYRDGYCQEMCKSFGYETDFEGLRCFALNVYKFGSQAYGDMMNQYDACIAYAHDGTKFTVSLYSIKTDIAVICKKYGGGGHKGAAGFTCVELPFKKKGV